MDNKKNEYFGLMMAKKVPSMEAVQSDFNQIAKKIQIITPMIQTATECSPMVAERVESALRAIESIQWMIKAERNG